MKKWNIHCGPFTEVWKKSKWIFTKYSQMDNWSDSSGRYFVLRPRAWREKEQIRLEIKLWYKPRNKKQKSIGMKVNHVISKERGIIPIYINYIRLFQCWGASFRIRAGVTWPEQKPQWDMLTFSISLCGCQKAGHQERKRNLLWKWSLTAVVNSS